MNDADYLFTRQLDAERKLFVYELTYGRARLCIGHPDDDWFVDEW